jgi:hypothetical protein
MKIVMTILFCVLTGMLSGCGQSAQEKLAQQQLDQREKAKNIMGDGNKPMPKPGKNIGGL